MKLKFYEDIIIRPIMSEKSVQQQEELHQYTFEVHPDANKIEIRKAVEKIFEVKVKQVRVQKYLGQSVMRRTRRNRIPGRTKSWKKAIVTLAAGQEIDFFKDVR